VKPLTYLFYTKEQATNDSIKEKEINVINPLVFIQSGENRGFAAGNNIALKYILANRSDGCVWFLNPDTVIETHCIRGFVNKINNHNKVILGSVIKYYKDPKKVLFYGGFKVHKLFHGIKRIVDCYNVDKIDAISGASLFISVASVRQLGLLPEEYFMYWEETHYCTQAKKMGYKFDVVEQEGCYVYDKAGTNTNSKYLKQYLYILNGLKYYRIFFSKRFSLIYFSCILKYILAFVRSSASTRKAIGNALRDYVLGGK
jgi:GT2 family glycosyltransferase